LRPACCCPEKTKLAITIVKERIDDNKDIFLDNPSFFMKKERTPATKGSQINNDGKLSNAANIFNAFD
jgi:hypothetical protein